MKKPPIDRRRFLHAAAAAGLPALLPRRGRAAVPGAERADSSRRDWCRRPGHAAVGAIARRRPDCRLVRLQSAPRRRLQGQERGRLARLPGLSQNPRPQRHRRGDRRHRRIPARAAVHSRLPGRQGCLRRKAADALHPGRPDAGRRGPPARPHLASRHPAALDGHQPRGLRIGPQRRLGKTAAKSAPWPMAARSRAPPSPSPSSPFRPGSIGTCGSTRPPSAPSTAPGWAGCAGAISPAAR